MIDLSPVVIFIAGVVVILVGAEILLRSAARIAAWLGVSPIVIGLTIVSVGTSAPELAVGLTAVAADQGPLAIGNIAGTNILNILLILGASAAVRPLPIRLQSLRLDIPAMAGAAVALILMSFDGRLTRAEGGLLVLAGLFYTLLVIRESRRQSAAAQRDFAAQFGAERVPARQRRLRLAWHAGLLVSGIALTVLGADLLVAGAGSIARDFAVPETVIGLTIVALGTSAPELATTLMATWKDERDVAIGNLIGSSTYNILAILGLTLLAAPDGIDVSREVAWIDLPLAALVAAVCLPVFRSDRCVSRVEGGVFVATYFVYLTALLVLRA
ncbi:MAG: calcium/sodium antiporter [Gammaproteobacteria bacterium]